MLPPNWRLDFAGLSIEVYRYWISKGTVSDAPEVDELKAWLEARGFDGVILRSSGVAETLYDRGKFKSEKLTKGWNFSAIQTAIEEIFEHAHEIDDKTELGIVVQEYLDAEYMGHLSNEHRVSPTINQWSYELEKPNWTPSKGINSKRTTSPDPNTPLRCGNQVPHQPLRSVAHYLVDEFKERCHLEWIVCRSTLYLAQIDVEWLEQDTGLNPRKDINTSTPPELDLSRKTSFKPYKINTPTRWPKLKNISDFDFDDKKPAPRIYPLSPRRVKAAFGDREAYSSIRDEMVALTGNRLVVRTDCVQKDVPHINLPRTDTMEVESALSWCQRTIRKIEESGISERNYVFLFHAFLPARASAWAYAKPGDPTVIVDALWGLPDGLQVLPVDTYEINVAKEKVVQTNSTFKPKFLTELDDGTWNYQNISGKKGRWQVLSDNDKIEIAQRTQEVADKLKSDAQIMWFCDIPSDYKVGRNLPWYRVREKFDPAPRQEVQFKPFLITQPRDLDRLPNEKVTLCLSPQANLIRDDSFLDAIVAVARERGLPVQLEGSILSHTFYRLNEEKIPVVLSNAPKYYRKRNKQVFGKLVRDKIPANIAEGGETVKEARLAKSDLNIGLAGKLLEEVEELLRATSESDEAEELSDILEVLKGLANSYGVSWSKVERIAKEKAQKRGGFKDGRVLIETALPHRESPLERQEQVRISDLGSVEHADAQVQIPASMLVATARGPGVIFSFEDDSSRFRVSIKQGKVQITRLDTKVSEQPIHQPKLF